MLSHAIFEKMPYCGSDKTSPIKPRSLKGRYMAFVNEILGAEDIQIKHQSQLHSVFELGLSLVLA